MTKEWEMIESGWWCLDGVGAVCRENHSRTPWVAYTVKESEPPIGRYRTMREAMDAVESAGKGE